MEYINPQVELVRGFLIGSSFAPSRLAKMAGLHANTLRDFKSPGWNPTTKTLNLLLSLISQHSSRDRREDDGATIPANLAQIKATQA